MTENENNSMFGWKSVFAHYTASDILADCKYPFCISVTLTILITFMSSDTFASLSEIVRTTMSILPNILSLLIAGYTVLLTFFWSDFGKNIRKYDHGRNLQKNILSSYAAAVCIMIFSLLVNFIFDAVIHLEVELPITISKWINGASIFSITILFFYPFWILKDTIINLYNLGQLSSFFDDNQKTYP